MKVIKWFIRGLNTALPYIKGFAIGLFWGITFLLFSVALYEMPTPMKIFWGVSITVLVLFFSIVMLALYWEDIMDWAQEKD